MPTTTPPAAPRPALADIPIDDVVAGTQRLTVDQALTLYHDAPIHDLGRWASAVAERIHGPTHRTYVIDRNINYTNVCSAKCTFCAFRRDGDEHDAYVLTPQHHHDKVRPLQDIGGTQILMQGGMHPDLGLEWYVDLLQGLKAEFPDVHVHGFSPPEFTEFVAVTQLDGHPTTEPGKSHTLPDDVWDAKLTAVMQRLIDAGLDSLPGGGGEIFAPHVRELIGLGKASSTQWLKAMAKAHELGMHTSATMMFGHIEGIRDRFTHMQLVRDWQDKAIDHDWPGRYMAFISWPFQRENTPLGRVPDYDREAGEPFPGDVLADAIARGEVDPLSRKAWRQAVPGFGKSVRQAGAYDYLRTQAVSRLFLDNIHSIGSSWVTMGPRIGQLGLSFGANDMGSVMMEENVVSAAGTTYCLTEEVLCHLIRDAGFTPAQRDNRYRFLNVHDTDDAPDRRVTDWSTQRAAALHIQRPDAPAVATPGDEGKNGTVPLTVDGTRPAD